MDRNDPCSGCGQKKTCRDVYDKIGKTKGPNVALKAIVAFLLPLFVFIVSLAGAEKLLEGRFEGGMLSFLSFLLAFGVTFLLVLVIRAFRGPVHNNQCGKGKFHDGDSR
jgi:hypothetical protein